MNRTEAEAFLREHKQAIVATIKRDGLPQMSNVLAAFHANRLLLSTSEGTAKYRNIARDPRVSVLVLGDNFWQYLVVEGQAAVTRLPEAQQPLREYYEIAAGKPHPNWEEYDEAMRTERRVLVSISVDRVYPLDS